MTAYRSIPHPSTGKSPAELLYGRKIRTKLPQLDSESVDQEVVDSDQEYKGKSKLYYDDKNHTSISNVFPGDKMLMRREMQNKVDTPFENNPVTVIEKFGNQLTVECIDGRRFKRNITCFKPYVLPVNPILGGEEEEGTDPDPSTNCASTTETEKAEMSVTTSEDRAERSETSQRPRRERRLPSRFKDYVMN